LTQVNLLQLSTSNRPKREIKKPATFDNSENCDDPEVFTSPATISANLSGKVSKKEGDLQKEKKPASIPAKSGSTKSHFNSLRNTRLNPSSSPFVTMFKHIIEPIIMYDKLEMLYNDKTDFKIYLKAKDLKNLSRERREEML
jgi:hypothetical protein